MNEVCWVEEVIRWSQDGRREGLMEILPGVHFLRLSYE